MQRRLSIALSFSVLIHLSFIAVLVALAYLIPEGIIGGGGADGMVVVSVVESEGNGSAESIPAPRQHSVAQRHQTREIPTTSGATGNAPIATESGNGGAIENQGAGGGEGGGGGGGVGPATGRGDPILSEIWRKINRAKYYPWTAKRSGFEGAPRVTFRIGDDGTINSVTLAKSCGIPELDEAALETVRRAAPLPRYPQPITLAIRYSLKFGVRP